QALAGLKLGQAAAPRAPQPQGEVPRSSAPASSAGPAPAPADPCYRAWTFGALPEIMEIKKGGQTLIGFPALIAGDDFVRIEVFDEPQAAAAKHRAGLRRLFALQIRDALRQLEKNLPDLQKMAVAYMLLGTQEALRAQII
ncbi:DUF3418 domain-containing protein, partial [Verminephrobacter aporrectodeae]|uniref:DUF3418 domain-containing protein n=1 Tax=Verminephrobacter aporrectodeae TaxID=1110389 RepID=UPI0002376CE0